MKQKKTIFLFVLVIFIWALSWPVNKIGLAFTSPANYIELRLVVGTIVMFAFAWASKNLILPNVKDLPIIGVVGLFQMGLVMALANYGLSLMDAGRATFLAYTMSIWMIPFYAMVNRKFSFIDGFSFFIGLVGIFLLIDPFDMGLHPEKTWIGDSFLLVAAFTWAIGIFLSHRMKWHRPMIQLLPWQLLLATVCVVAFASFLHVPFLPPVWDPILLSTLIYTGAVSIAFGYWGMILVNKRLSPGMTSMGLLFVPIISLIISSLFMGEKVTVNFLIAVSLITFSPALHIYANRDERTDVV